MHLSGVRTNLSIVMSKVTVHTSSWNRTITFLRTQLCVKYHQWHPKNNRFSPIFCDFQLLLSKTIAVLYSYCSHRWMKFSKTFIQCIVQNHTFLKSNTIFQCKHTLKKKSCGTVPISDNSDYRCLKYYQCPTVCIVL